jgi:hypothetical protein
MTKQIDLDALRVLTGGVMKEAIGDGGRKDREEGAKRIGRLRSRSKCGDTEASVRWMEEILKNE